MDEHNVEEPAEMPTDPSTTVPTPAARRRWPLLAVLGLALSVSGGIVEIFWWEDAGYGWESLFRFFTAGAPFWWSVGLLLMGSALTWAHWRDSDRKGWAVPGLLITSIWSLRITLGLAILFIWWLWNQAGTDIVDAFLPKKKQRKRRRRKPSRSRKGRGRKRKRRSRGQRSRTRRPYKGKRYKGRTRGRRPKYKRRRTRRRY